LWLLVVAFGFTFVTPAAWLMVVASLLSALKPAAARLSAQQTLHYALGVCLLYPLALLMLPVRMIQARIAQGQAPSSSRSLGEAWRHQPNRLDESLPAKRNDLTADEAHHQATLFHLAQQAEVVSVDTPASMTDSAMGQWSDADSADEDEHLAEGKTTPPTVTKQPAKLRYGQREVACQLAFETTDTQQRLTLTYKTHTFESDWHATHDEALAQLNQLLTKRGFTLLLNDPQRASV
jgi:hypothetical protein